MDNRYDFVSLISLDTGAKNTGIILAQCKYGDLPSSGVIEGAFIHIAEDKITFGQATRRSKRHQVRGFKRRQMAKKLLSVILKDAYGVDLTGSAKLGEFAMGLMNRRGFTYLSEEMDRGVLDDAGPYWWAERLGDFFNDSEPLSDQIESMTADPRKCGDILRDAVFAPQNRRDFLKVFKDLLPEDPDAQMKLASAWVEVVRLLNGVVHAQFDGHHPRSEYFKHIHDDLANLDAGRQLTAACSLSPSAMARLIGHVSNLQLRVLRRYFNDISMKGTPRWESTRMSREFLRYVKAWHAKNSDEKRRVENILSASRTHGEDIIATWLALDPETTVPPMEDMNNRRPPKCQSLHLDPSILDAEFPGWKDWTKDLVTRNPDYILSDPDSYIHSQITAPHHQLQAALDRTRERDPYSLRSLASLKGEPRHELKEAHERLSSAVGAEQASKVIQLARRYYTETAMAANGDWTGEASGRILRKCDRHPPHKVGIRSRLIGALLGVHMSESMYQDFIGLYGRKFSGSTTLRSLGSRCAEYQKTHGEAFKELFVEARHGAGKAGKDLANLAKAVSAAATMLGGFLNSGNTERFNNPFVYAQMYNLIEQEPRGFNKTCRICAAIDGWRSLVGGDGIAHARRLPADAGRPFDGMLARLIQRLSWEIAQAKFEQIRTLPRGARISIPIIVEENQFRFTAELQDIKKAQIGTRKDKKIEERAFAKEDEWLEKYDRIHADSCGVCPYTGLSLTGGGQVDHILPRSSTRDTSGAVFNSEANLIYCSTRGNTQKGTTRYTLSDLKAHYLNAVFGTHDTAVIQNMIESKLDLLLAQESSVTAFHALQREDRAIIRHALFIPGTDQKVITLLDQLRVAKVNGTQRWMAKQIANILRDLAAKERPDLELAFKTHRIPPEITRPVRYILAEHNPLYKKPRDTSQSAYSHVVDAACGVIAYYNDPRSSTFTGMHGEAAATESPTDMMNWMPTRVRLVHVDRKSPADKARVAGRSLFKDGIYAIHYVPFLIRSNGSAGFGFNPHNFIEISKGADVIYALLRPLMRDENGNPAPLFEQAAKIAISRSITVAFYIHKDSAIQLMHRVATKPHSGEERKAAMVLNGVTYWTRKVNLGTHLLVDPMKKEKVIKSENALLESLDDIKIDIPSALGRLAGTLLTHPAATAWRKFLRHELIRGMIGNPLPSTEALDSALRAYFNPSRGARRHCAVRKEFSLPVTDKPTGACMIRRKSPHGWLWQAVAIADTCFAGFAQSRDGGIDWHRAVLLPAYRGSENLFKYGEMHDDGVTMACRMDDWLDLPADSFASGIRRLRMCPNSDSRCKLEITIPEDEFIACFGLSSVYEIPSLTSPPTPWPWPSLPKPRNKIVIKEIGDQVRVEYIVASTPASMRTAYQEAWVKSLRA